MIAINKALVLLVVTWMLVVPSLLVWNANASMELPEGGATCEIPPAQIIKLAPFTCITEPSGMFNTVMNCE